jgi:hypothetical protein
MKFKSTIFVVILAGLLLTLLFSCKKETPATRYQVINNCKRYELYPDPNANGTFWSTTAYVYKGKVVISQQNLGIILPDGGTSDAIEVNSGATSVRISFFKTRVNQYQNIRYYVVTPADITAGELTTITITDVTPISTTLPTQ